MRAEVTIVRMFGAWHVRVRLYPEGRSKPVDLFHPYPSHAEAAKKVNELAECIELDADPTELARRHQRRSTA